MTELDKLQSENLTLRFGLTVLGLSLIVALVLIVVMMVHYKGCPQ